MKNRKRVEKMSLNKSNYSKDNKTKETLLLKKSKRGILRILFGRTGIVIFLLTAQVIFLLTAQIVLLFTVFRFLGNLLPYLVSILVGFTIIMVVRLMNSGHNTSVKMSWIILIITLPGFGGLLYIFIQKDIGHRTLKKRLKKIIKESKGEFTKQENLM